MSRREKIRDLLVQARKLMNHSGAHWIKNTARDTSGPEARYCSLGALWAACGGYESASGYPSPENRLLYEEAVNILLRAAGTTDIARWNDADDRTWGDVEAAFKKAAELALKA